LQEHEDNVMSATQVMNRAIALKEDFPFVEAKVQDLRTALGDFTRLVNEFNRAYYCVSKTYQNRVRDNAQRAISDGVLYVERGRKMAKGLKENAFGGIAMDKFTGAPEKYLAWLDKFTTLILERESDDVLRMNHLHKWTDGEANTYVKRWNPERGNFDACFADFKRKYGDKQLILSATMAKLHSKKPSSDRVSDQIKFLEEVAVDLNSLEKMGYAVKMGPEGFAILQHLKARCNHELTSQWTEKVQAGELPDNILSLMSFLEKKFRARRAVDSTRPRYENPGFKKPQSKPTALVAPKGNQQKSYGGASGGRAKPPKERGGERTPPQSKKSCPFCKGEHSARLCGRMKKLTTQERWDALKATKQQFCATCMEVGHATSSCKLDYLTCREKGCGRRHNTYLHNPQSQ